MHHRSVALWSALLSLGFWLALAGPAVAQEERGTVGVASPERGRPVYDVEIRPDPAEGTLAVRWRVRFLPDARPGDEVTFFLSSGMEVEEVSGRGVAGYAVEDAPIPGWSSVVVRLADDLEPGREVALEIRYRGEPALPPSGINSLSPEWIELNADSGWHPLFATFDQLMSGTARIVLPGSWDVVGSGEVRREGGAHVLRTRVPQLDVAFAAAPALERVAGDGFTIHHRGAAPAAVSAALASAEACAVYLNERYGQEAPLEGVDIVLVDRPSNAYNRRDYITLSHFDPEDDVATSRFVCHELAHSWSWGAHPMGPDHWLTEGFAEYVAARFVRHRFGQESFDSLMTAWWERGRGQGPVWTPEASSRGPDPLLYRKAPVLLSRLEERLGTGTFEGFLHRYMTGKERTTSGLLAVLEEVAGREAAAAFRKMLAQGAEGS